MTFTPPPKPVDELKILKLNPLDEYKVKARTARALNT
jgi:hypothetical protein